MVARLLGFIFGGIGLLQILIALVFGINTSLAIASSITANGVVIDGGDTSSGRKVRALIEFTTASDGQTVRFYSAIASNPPEFQTGQKVKVYYQPADPAGTARVDSLVSLWFWSGLFGILGLVFLVIGLISLAIWFTAERRKKWLMQYGQRITAEVTAVKVNTHIHNLGKSPYYVVARSRETENSINPVFRSRNIWNLPATIRPGTDVSVLVDPHNYRRYYVEIPNIKK